jgi:hypothetical protein
LHLDKVVFLSSLFLMCLFTSLFWGLSRREKNFSVLVFPYICLDFVSSLCSLLIISTTHSESKLQNMIFRFYLLLFYLWHVLFVGKSKFLRNMGYL